MRYSGKEWELKQQLSPNKLKLKTCSGDCN